MYRSLIVLSLLVSLSRVAAAQAPMYTQTYPDSLLRVIAGTTSDSTKANAHYLLTDYWVTTDSVKAKQHLSAGRPLAEKYPLLRALSGFYEGRLYFTYNPPRAAEAFMRTIKALEGMKDKNAWQVSSAAWYNYAIMKKNEKGDAYLIDVLMNKAIPLAEKAANPEKTAHYYSQLGTLLMYNAQFDKAEIYNNKAIDLLKTDYPQSSTLLNAYLAATSIYLYTLRSGEAKKTLDKARDILKPYRESIHYVNYYYNEGTYYATIRQNQQAFVSLDKGIALAKKYNQPMLLQMLTFRKYNIFLETKEYAKARDLLTTVLKEGTLAADANNRRMMYQQLSQLNASMGDMGAAYQWLMDYNKVNDSLHESQVKFRINELEVKYRNVENAKKIAALEAANKMALLSAKNNRLMAWLLGILSLLALIVAAVLVSYYRNKRQAAAEKAAQQLREMEQQQALAVVKAILEGEERERKRVALDLHDGLGGLLAGVKMDVSAVTDKLPAGIFPHRQLSAAVTQLDGSVNELRRIARNMMPETLLKFGLVTALKDFCEGFGNGQTKIVLQCYGLDNIDQYANTRVMIYRIIQELVTNALKHAHASTILVDCIMEKKQVQITVEDNGSGFDANRKKPGIGLDNVRTRVSYLNGSMDIQSEQHVGTTITIMFNAYDE